MTVHFRPPGGYVGDLITFERDGRLWLDFEDHEGQRLGLVDDGGFGEAHPWDRSPVPAEHQIRGLGPITMSVPKLEPTARVVTDGMGMRASREYQRGRSSVQVFEMGDGGPAAELHVAAEPHLEQRKRIGLQVMLFLLIFGSLLYYTKKKVWARMPDGSPLHH